jgi:hypothetical protein
VANTPDRADGTPDESDKNRPLHDLAEKVVPDPDNPLGTILLIGYLGAGPKGTDLRRIYLDLDFCKYVEIKKCDILFAQKADPSALEKPTEIIIKSTATLSLCRSMEAPFLKGAIASGYSWECHPCHYCVSPGPCTEDHPHTSYEWPRGQCSTGDYPPTSHGSHHTHAHGRCCGCGHHHHHHTTRCKSPEGHPPTS